MKLLPLSCFFFQRTGFNFCLICLLSLFETALNIRWCNIEGEGLNLIEFEVIVVGRDGRFLFSVLGHGEGAHNGEGLYRGRGARKREIPWLSIVLWRYAKYHRSQRLRVRNAPLWARPLCVLQLPSLLKRLRRTFGNALNATRFSTDKGKVRVSPSEVALLSSHFQVHCCKLDNYNCNVIPLIPSLTYEIIEIVSLE